MSFSPSQSDKSRQNLLTIFLSQARRFSSKPALWFKQKGTARYESLSWSEWAASVEKTSNALKFQGIAKGDPVAIIAENRPEWTYVDLGTLSLGAILVPIYPTLAIHDVQYILRHSESKILFTSNRELAEKILQSKKTECPALEKVILFNDSTSPEGLTGWQEFLSAVPAGAEAFEERIAAVQPDDLATLIYTSGTTGPQKGVMLTHRNFMENARLAKTYIHVSEADKTISFLPLSHVFERLAGYYFMIDCGAQIAYAESMLTVPQDIRIIKPTVAAAVPRFYEKVHAKIMDQVRAKSTKTQKIFRWALAVGKLYRQALRSGRLSLALRVKYGAAKLLVLRKIRNAMGGKIRFFISGGAPLSKHLAEFFDAAGVLILEGYGLTETAPVIAVNSEADYVFGTVGKPLPEIEVKIAQDGEILTRSACVMKGYYRDPEATSRVIQDGWFATGDIGEFNENGFLKITDRKKDLIVTSGGKNIAPQNLEGLLMEDPLIQQAVVIGDKRNYLIALLVLNRDEALKRTNSEGAAWADVLKSEGLRSCINRVLEEKMHEKASYEKIKHYALLENELTLEAGELTPTMKVKRRVVMEKYAAVIEEAYREGDRLYASRQNTQ